VDRAVLSNADATTVILGVRPEDLDIAESGFEIEVDVVEELGADAYVYGHAPGDDLEIIARVDGRTPPAKGELVKLRAKPDHVHLFSTKDGHRLDS
jgi:multiple sugar transport system ATP-binding protein